MTSRALFTMQDQIEAILSEVNKPELTVLGRFLRERIENPQAFVVMLGETSSGKSSLINGLLQREVLAAAVKPTTATVTELLEDRNCEVDAYYAVNKDATLEQVDYELFKELEGKPDKDLQRLRLKVPKFPYQLQGLRLFDTPGYNSLFDEHEEVLKDFIPESDAVIYTVAYRVGVQENDHHFLSFASELIQEDTPILLVINRCPREASMEDKRVQEIMSYVNDCLHRKVECFLVPSVSVEENKSALPQAPKLWEKVGQIVNSKERMDQINHNLATYQQDLLMSIKLELDKRIMADGLSAIEQAEIEASYSDLSKGRTEIHEIIDKEYAALDKKLEMLFNGAAKGIKEQLGRQINEANKWTSQDECIGFVMGHLMPLEVKKQTKEITYHLQRELEAIDENINSYLITALDEFQREVALKLPRLEKYAANLLNKVLRKSLGEGLTQFFAKYGGRGGSKAGVANAAKKALKKVGELFGKKFSRKTYNNLAHFLKKIGATSSKALSSAAAVIMEGVFYVVDSLRWQGKLVKAVDKGVDTWHEETLIGVRQNLKSLQEGNHKLIDEVLADVKEGFSVENDEDYDTIKNEQLIKRVNALIMNS